MKKYSFSNYSCGELCPNNHIVLELSRSDSVHIIEQMNLNGWKLHKINGEKVVAVCSCFSPIFSDGGKYCIDCQRKIENEKRQLKLPIF